MKYKIVDHSEETHVVMEDGGIASIRLVDGEDYNCIIDLYQDRMTQDMLDNDTLWDEVGEGKMYCEEMLLENENDLTEAIEFALDWLCPFCDEYEEDNDIWEDFQ